MTTFVSLALLGSYLITMSRSSPRCCCCVCWQLLPTILLVFCSCLHFSLSTLSHCVCVYPRWTRDAFIHPRNHLFSLSPCRSASLHPRLSFSDVDDDARSLPTLPSLLLSMCAHNVFRLPSLVSLITCLDRQPRRALRCRQRNISG